MNTLIKRIDTNNITTADFTNFVTAAKRMQNEVNEAWAAVEQAMRDAGVSKIDGEWGRIQFVERKTWFSTETLPPRFYKATLNTTKLNAMVKLGEKLPVGVDYAVSESFTKVLK
jgi:hypothetical protein